jgi:hypothetical protein
LWFLVCIFSWWFNYAHNSLNNYRVFIGVHHHLVEQTNLFIQYPQEYGDISLYGPLFGLFISPFAYLPIGLGSLLWVLLNACLLICAVRMLPLSAKQKWILLLLATLEFANTSHSSQSNCIMTALIIFSYILIEKGVDEWATCLIVLGAFIKIYPVMAFVFFLFSKRKPMFLFSTLLWISIFFVIPMFVSSQHFILQSYLDWFYTLVAKNASNREIGASINYSILGVVDGFAKNTSTSNVLVIVIGLSIFSLPLLRRSQYTSQRFRLFFLSSVLLFVVLFSTSSEHPTYIIAVTGVFIWMVQLPDIFTKKYIWLIVSLLILTGLGPTDAMPAYVRKHFIDMYAVKAWPCIIVWCIILYQLMRFQFNNPSIENIEDNKRPA